MTSTGCSQKPALHKRTALRVAVFYALIAGLWIFLSDKALTMMFTDPSLLTAAQTIKGWLFVAVTAILLFSYMRHCLKNLHAQEALIEEEQAKAQQDLAESFNQMRTLFDSMNAVIYVADIETHELLFVNRFTTDAFGDDWKNQTCHAYLQQGMSDPCGFCTNNQLLVAGEAGPPVMWEFRNTKNQRWYECFDKAIRWTDGRLVRLEIAMDVTERKELEKIKDDLLSAVSHEMRTPLTAISGFSELLRDVPSLPADVRRHVDIIYREANKMTDLVNSFLDARKFKSDRARIDYEYLSLRELVTRSMENTRDCQSHHDITIDIPETLPVFGNRKEIIQVFTQFLSNACRYSPQGGQIIISGHSDNRRTVIRFSDQGIGIPAHEHENIFKPFHRLDTGDRRRTGGVGMGLTLAREIVNLHGGYIRLESAPGQGSSFMVVLPLPPGTDTPDSPPLSSNGHHD